MQTRLKKWLTASATLLAGGFLAGAADDVISVPSFGPATAGAAGTNSEPAPTLHIGDPAPKLTTGAWVQGQPVKELEKGKAYLIDFWATWCQPCIEAIPRLNDISQKYQDKNLVVIGQVCWEADEGNDQDVTDFIGKVGTNMTYRVALDDTNGSVKGKMSDNWMTAGGQTLIPETFLVDTNGMVAWIGEPMDLKDSDIDAVLSGKWDFKAAAADYARRMQDQDQLKKNNDQLDKLSDQVDEAMATKDWDTALARIGDIQKLLPADETNRLDLLRFVVLIGKKDYPTAYNLAGQISEAHKDDVHLQDRLAWTIATDPTIEKRDLDVAETIAKRGNDAAKGQDASILDTMARLRFMKGKPDEAITLEQQALGVADDEEKADIQRTLDAYKKGELPKEEPAPSPTIPDVPDVPARGL